MVAPSAYDSGSPYGQPIMHQLAQPSASPPNLGNFANPSPVTVVGYNMGTPIVASSGAAENGSRQPPPPAPSTFVPHPPRGPLPPVQMVNSRLVTFEYEVTKLGPSGLGTVEVYMSRDEGRTWQRASGEQGGGPAVPLETRGNAGPQRHSVTVQLEQEGIYGFYLVVVNGRVWASRRPRAATPRRSASNWT